MLVTWKFIWFTGVESNFEVVSTAFATTQGIEYDFGSLMHYDAYAFTRNGQPTIEPRNSSIPLDSLGQRREFSSGDLKHVNTLYCGESEYYVLPKHFRTLSAVVNIQITTNLSNCFFYGQ